MNESEQLAIATVRTLAIDAVEHAKSGHPGAPMGLAPLGYTLFTRHLAHDPADTAWPNRDRFVLSAGHASMLLYARHGVMAVLRAVAALGESLRLRPTPWQTRRVVPLVDTAAAHVLRHEPEQACAALLDALDLALDAGYLAELQRLRGVRARFPVEWSGLECVADLDERLRMPTRDP